MIKSQDKVDQYPKTCQKRSEKEKMATMAMNAMGMASGRPAIRQK